MDFILTTSFTLNFSSMGALLTFTFVIFVWIAFIQYVMDIWQDPNMLIFPRFLTEKEKFKRLLEETEISSVPIDEIIADPLNVVALAVKKQTLREQIHQERWLKGWFQIGVFGVFWVMVTIVVCFRLFS